MQLLSPSYLDFVRRLVDAATMRSLLVDLMRLQSLAIESRRPNDESCERLEERDAA
jgi:hypothetical protein